MQAHAASLELASLPTLATETPTPASASPEENASDRLLEPRSIQDGRQLPKSRTYPPHVQLSTPPSHAAAAQAPTRPNGPSVLAFQLQHWAWRSFSYVCTGCFISSVLAASVIGAIGPKLGKLFNWCRGREADEKRPLHQREHELAAEHNNDRIGLRCDVEYYCHFQGIAVEQHSIKTSDGFWLEVFHLVREERAERTPGIPVLLMHGLLQSSGTFCVNDENSLAFYLHRRGFDVWLGNNRCWFKPRHEEYTYGDPRMWAWNVCDMGNKDLPAMVDHVLMRTGHEKLALVAHSQGTTQSFMALSRDQIPELGRKLSCFCALAPAVYAGPLIEHYNFKFMRSLGDKGFRLFFGAYAFIPLMMSMHRILPGAIYGHLGYLVLSYLFDWDDRLWERRLRNRFFQFSPTYVSAESMRWWMREFAVKRCILEDDQNNPWYDDQTPPMALWIGEQDRLVDGAKLLERLEKCEPHVRLVHVSRISEYAHLDVLWSMDAVEHVTEPLIKVILDTWQDA